MTKGFLGLSIGNKEISFAYLEKEGGQLALLRKGTVPLEKNAPASFPYASVLEDIRHGLALGY